MWGVFKKHLAEILPEIHSVIFEALSTEQFPSIRYHHSKNCPHKYSGSPVPWEKDAIQLGSSPAFYLDPAWHAGAYYVQESSSMFLGYIIRQIAGSMQFSDSRDGHPYKVLDLCAAPGGKSTHLLDVLPDNALLVANELISKRNAILRENIIRLGKPNVIVTQNDAVDFLSLENYFDLVVIDAPCSGEGLFRRDKDAIYEWSPDQVRLCAGRQRDILGSAMQTVKENGYLIYSTCTFEPSENEEQVSWLLQQGFETVPVNIKTFHDISEGLMPDTYRFYPHQTSGSGFFIACLRKVQSSKFKVQSERPKRKRSLSVCEIKNSEIENWVEHTANFSILQTPYALHAFPKALVHEMFFLNHFLRITYFGTEIGELKKDIFIPAHALALSTIVKKEIPAMDMNEDRALQFLRKSPALSLNEGDAGNPGWKLVRYQGLNLGWVKVLKDRINNYLPNHWRILH